MNLQLYFNDCQKNAQIAKAIEVDKPTIGFVYILVITLGRKSFKIHSSTKYNIKRLLS